MREALMVGTAVVPDLHVLKVVNLVGLTFGVLGSLFFAYGLLGRAPDSPLRALIRHGVPGTLGALVAVPLSAFYTVGSVALYQAVLPAVIFTSSPLQFDVYGWVIAPAAYGMFLGIMTSQLAVSPGRIRWKTQTSARAFSWQRFRWAVLLATAYQVISTAVTVAVYWRQFADSFQAGPVETLVAWLLNLVAFALIVGIIAGLWERLTTARSHPAPGRVAMSAGDGSGGNAAASQATEPGMAEQESETDAMPSLRTAPAPINSDAGEDWTTLGAPVSVPPSAEFPLSSARGALIGASVAFAVGFVPGLVGGMAALVISVARAAAAQANLVDLQLGILTVANLGGSMLSALADAATGAVIGAVLPPALWFANRAQQHDMEIIGLIFLLAGFVVQAVDPLVGLFTP